MSDNSGDRFLSTGAAVRKLLVLALIVRNSWVARCRAHLESAMVLTMRSHKSDGTCSRLLQLRFSDVRPAHEKTQRGTTCRLLWLSHGVNVTEQQERMYRAQPAYAYRTPPHLEDKSRFPV